jgi:chromosome partitioning protein
LKVIALYAIKGGVGKTAACVNLAYLAAKEGQKTLVIDLDPQGAASFYFRIRPAKKLRSKTIIKGGKNVDKNIKGTDFENLDLLPSTMSYRNLDIFLNNAKRPKKVVRNMLRPFQSEYDYVFLDCPPNITLVSENIFRAAHLLLVPVIPTTLSKLALDKLVDFFEKKNLFTEKITGFFSMVERRKKLHKELLMEISSGSTRLFKTIIPYVSEVERMGIHRSPLASFAASSKAAVAYEALWKEIEMSLP